MGKWSLIQELNKEKKNRKGGNYEYINGYFYSWVYHRRMLLGLVGNEVRQEMVRKRIKT